MKKRSSDKTLLLTLVLIHIKANAIEPVTLIQSLCTVPQSMVTML